MATDLISNYCVLQELEQNSTPIIQFKKELATETAQQSLDCQLYARCLLKPIDF